MFTTLLRKYSHQLCLMFLVLLFLYMRLPGLDSDVTNSDAVRWHRRTTNFLSAVKSGDFKETYQRYHPGVTLMLTNSLVKQAIQFVDNSSSELNGLTIENSAYYPMIDHYSKVFQVLILAGIFSIQLLFIKKLFGFRVSIFYAFIMALEPYLVGIDRWFHLTSFETYFAFTSLLSLLLWKNKLSPRYFVLSSLLLAFAILSKVGALVTLPVMLLIILSRAKCEGVVVTIKRFTCYLLLIFLFVFIFFPALWVAPAYVFQKILNGIVGGVSEDVRANPFTGWSAYLFYLAIFCIKISPVTLVMFPIALSRKLHDISNKKYILMYFLIYLLSLSVSEKKIDRYVLVMFPPLILYVSFYLSRLKGDLLYLVLLGYVLTTLFVKSVYFPVYSSYYTPFLGSRPIARALDMQFYNNSGEYYAQAGLYLNNIVLDHKVWVPYGIESFDYYFKRDAQMEFTSETALAVTSIEHLEEVRKKCPEVINSFGTRKESVVFILSCK